MADPGLKAPVGTAPANPTPIGDHDASLTPSFDFEDYAFALWYRYTPGASGVVSIDLYRSSAPGDPADQAGVEAWSDALGFNGADGWVLAATEYGGPDGYLERYNGIVEAGVPVTFDVQGGKWVSGQGYTPFDVNVRVSDVLPVGNAPWQGGGTIVKRDFTDLNPSNQSYYYQPAGGAGATKASIAQPSVFDNRRPGGRIRTDNPGRLQYGWETARRGYEYNTNTIYTTAPDRPGPQTNTVAETFGSWQIGGTLDANEVTVTAAANMLSTRLVAANLQSYAESVLGFEVGYPPEPTETVIYQNGGVKVREVQIAPDVFQFQVNSNLPQTGPVNLIIMHGATGDRWGPNAYPGRTIDLPGVTVGNQAGPESLLGEPDAQLIRWTPTAASPYTTVSPALMAPFLAGTDDLSIVGYLDLHLVDAPPASEPLPDDPISGTKRWAYGFGSTLHVLVSFEREYRQLPKPALWEDVLGTGTITGGPLGTTRHFRP